MTYSSYWIDREDDSDISHFGVKGMKWGVRRYENADGTLTALGKKRKAIADAKATKGAKRESNIRFAKREFRDARDLEKLGDKKSKRQLKLEKKYKEKGYTDQEAALKAYRRRRAEKIVAAVGITAVAALIAGKAYQHHLETADAFLNENDLLGRVAVNDDGEINKAFYAFNNKKDARKYQGILGDTLQARGNQVYRKDIKISKKIKVASDENARKIFSTVIDKNDGMKRSLKALGEEMTMFDDPANPQYRLAKRAMRDLDQGKNSTKSVYDFFNLALVDHSLEGQVRADSFYSAMKKAGYGAIKDANDRKYSGYGAKNPMIVFDVSSVKVDRVTKLGSDYIQSNLNAAMKQQLGEMAAKGAAKTGAVIAGIYGASRLVKQKSNNRIVEEYRKKHPNTEMSANEILRNYRL